MQSLAIQTGLLQLTELRSNRYVKEHSDCDENNYFEFGRIQFCILPHLKS